MKSAKCRPPKSPYHKNDFKKCKKTTSFDALFMENVNDIADTMSEIMIVCGIHRCKAKCSRQVIVQAFQFYDIQRHTFEEKIQCGICRNDIVADFERKSFMNRIEALLAYSIVKRAVKAFYHGTPEHSLRSPVMEAVVLKEQQFAWQHAAKKTIKIFQCFKHAFFNAQSNCDKQIVSIYNELYERLRSRADPVIVEEHHPRGCVNKIIIGTRSPPKLDSENKYKCVQKPKKTEDLRAIIQSLPIKTFPFKSCNNLTSPCPLVCNPEIAPPHSTDSAPAKLKKKPKNVDLNLPRCYQCDCPRIMCDCDIEPESGIVAIDCSQGPFECQWVRTSKRERPDPCIEKGELHQCPVDCPTSESSNDDSDDCECCSGESSSEEYSESEADSEEEDEFEKSDNEEALNRMMPKDLPKMGKTYGYQMRTISKVPPNHTRATLRPFNKN